MLEQTCCTGVPLGSSNALTPLARDTSVPSYRLCHGFSQTANDDVDRAGVPHLSGRAGHWERSCCPFSTVLALISVLLNAVLESTNTGNNQSSEKEVKYLSSGTRN